MKRSTAMKNCFYWKNGESGNLGAFLKVLTLLDQNDRNEPTAGTQSNIRQHL